MVSIRQLWFNVELDLLLMKEQLCIHTIQQGYQNLYPSSQAGKLWEALGDVKSGLLRVCILEMHLLKAQVGLEGKTPAEEYEYFCREKLADPEYIRTLLEKYPELDRLIKLRLDFAGKNRETVERLFERDFGGSKDRLKRIWFGQSDSHRGGQTVAFCETENGKKLVYKPHGLEKEILYQRIYGWLCEAAGSDFLPVELHDGGDYGWEELLEIRPCKTLEQVERYFFRMGIHLFLCYVLHGTDMHWENFLASGEYPLLVDAETLPGIFRKTEISSAQDRIRAFLQDTVLTTGILPVPVWRTEQGAVILSALHRNGQVKSPMKLPVVVASETSEMRIDYRYVDLKIGNCLPVYEGEAAEPGEYVECLCRGFEKAYRIWMKRRKEAVRMAAPFWRVKSRFLIRHTQQYKMYLSASLHPSLLRDNGMRRELFERLKKSGEATETVEKEIEALMKLDIPLFECRADETEARFGASAYEEYQERLSRMGEKDLWRQTRLIRLSMELADIFSCRSQYFARADRRNEGNGTALRALRRVQFFIEKEAFAEKDDMCWMKLHMEDNGSWRLMPVDASFYDGMGGIAVFAAAAGRKGGWEDQKFGDRLIRSFERAAEKEADGRGTGLMTGSGSVVFSWICLYKLCGERGFLEKAEKYASILSGQYQSDQKLDLLSGNAGAVVALVCLFEASGNRKWLELARRIGEWLWERVLPQAEGAGWICEGMECPLSGLAHGNSGFILAYAGLLGATGEKSYVGRIRQLMDYENSMYSEEKGNWRDLRQRDREAYGNAWCHGAPGILLSRLRLLSLPEFEGDILVRQDIRRAAAVLFAEPERNGLCFCHGAAGNLWIMMEYDRIVGADPREKARMEELKQYLINRILSEDGLLPQDRYNYGFMTGLAGMGYVLGQMDG